MSTTVSPETPRQLKDRQLGALRGSIGKWTLIVDSLKHSRDFVDRGGVDCACCVEFFQSDNGVNCEKCPIRLDTGKGFCENTPYDDWVVARDDPYEFPRKSLKAAKKELNYLIKLATKYTD